MKTTILTTAIAIIALIPSAFAHGKKEHPAAAKKEISVEGNFKKLTVGNEIKLVLLPAGEKNAATVTGYQSDINTVIVKVEKNEMKIWSTKTLRRGSIVVYLPAADLSYIELQRGASVSGDGTLKFNDLTVYANPETHIDLKVIGNLTVKSSDDCDFIYQKNEVEKVVYLKQ